LVVKIVDNIFVDNVRYSNADTSIVISIFDSPTRQKSNVPLHLLWIFNYLTRRN